MGPRGTLEHGVRAQDEVAWTCLPCSRFALIAGGGARGPSKELEFARQRLLSWRLLTVGSRKIHLVAEEIQQQQRADSTAALAPT